MIDFDELALKPCFDTFAVPCVYNPGTGAELLTRGIFNEFSSVEDFDKQTGASVINRMPTLALRLVELNGRQSPVEGETVQVAGRLWAIHDPTEDGHGQILLKLVKTVLR